MQKGREKSNLIYLYLLIGFEVIYWLITIVNSGQYFDTYFVRDYNDSGMDFYNMLALLDNEDPYIFKSNYPAMCFLILKIFWQMIPMQWRCADGKALREFYFVNLEYHLLLIICAIAIWQIVASFTLEKRKKTILPTVVMLSGPILFTIERGNLIMISFIFLLLFVRFYNSESKWMRYVSYVCLAFSAAIKIYPAFFGILILKEKRYKEACLAVILGAFLFTAPFFFFDGIHSGGAMLRGMRAASEIQGNAGMGYNFSFINLVKIIFAIGGSVINEIPGIIIIIPILIVVFIYFTAQETWKKMFAISLVCIWIPTFSYTYMLILLIVPFLFFCNEIKTGICIAIYRILYLIILIPIALPSLERLDFPEAQYPLSWSTVIINMSIIFFVITLIVDNILQIIKKKI